MAFDFDRPGADDAERRVVVTKIDDAPPAVPATAPTTLDSSGDRWLFAFIGLLGGLAIALATYAFWPDDNTQLNTADVDAAIAQALADQSTPVTATDAYEQISPSVVAVRAIRDGEEPTIGTGIVLNDQGEILTANHLVFGADQIELRFSDGTVSQGRLVSNETSTDIAVLTADDRPLNAWPVVLGNPRTLRIGDPVYAVGNPLGLTSSISAGIISGLERNIPFPDDSGTVFENLIQFDAAINQGSSGGPLLNADGHVIGIVTALADPTGQGFFIGIGFAVPIDIAAAGAAEGPSQ